MFIIDITYIVAVEELDRHLDEHVEFLKKYHNENIFIASGPKVPRTGGIILALADSQQHVEEIIQEDPFYVHNVADFTITEFLTPQHHPELAKVLKQ